MIILGQSILRVVLQTSITSHPTSIASPNQREQVDPLVNPPMLARPVARHQVPSAKHTDCPAWCHRFPERLTFSQPIAQLLATASCYPAAIVSEVTCRRRALALVLPRDVFARL